jgi:pSer/pThr/pTyr-binding forkhead associated (FHA) protein
MPRFTIAREGQIQNELTLSDDRIELGSANTCPLFIDDLLIALKQAVFVQEDSGEYRVEPLTRVPALKIGDSVVEAPQSLADGDSVSVEGYTITINYAPEQAESIVEVSSDAEPEKRSPRTEEPPLPAPLVPDPPVPLATASPAAASVPPPMAPPPAAPAADDQERTVFVQSVGSLVATAGPLIGKEWGLRSGELRIGRDLTKNEIAVRFAADGQVDSSISRRHASIHVIGDQVFVEDQGSAAGTYVNGQKAPAGERVPVKDRDSIEIRSARVSTVLEVRLTIRSSTPSSPPPSPPPLSPSPPPLAPIPEAAPPPPEFNPPEYVREDGPGFDAIFSDPEAGSQKPRPSAERIPEDRVSEAVDDNPFQPVDDGGLTGSWPKWIWVLVAVGVVVLAGILLLVLGE